MWLFSKSGYFSAVRHFDKPDVMHVRARFEGDLERLCAAHGVEPKVVVTPGNDYRFRMDFARAEWVRIVSEEAEAIDYGNFKAAVHDGTGRDAAYMGVWDVMRRAQQRKG